MNFVAYFILGSLDLDPGSQGKPMNSWCVSFETECMFTETDIWAHGII